MVAQFEVYLATLDPTVGAEIRKTRPCVIVSPNETNRFLHTVIIAPLTSKGRAYPYRIPLIFQGKKGEIALDQLRSVDKSRLIKKLGIVGDKTAIALCTNLQDMFEY